MEQQPSYAYFTIRSQILALEPLPSLDRMFNMVQQEEHHRRVMINRDNRTEQVDAFAAQHGGKSQGATGERPTCRHCGKYGHDEAACFEIISYPANWGSRGGSRVHGRGRGGRGAGRGRGRESAHAIQASNEAHGCPEPEPNQIGTFGFTPE